MLYIEWVASNLSGGSRLPGEVLKLRKYTYKQAKHMNK